MADRFDSVLNYWFGESTDQAEILATRGQLWFGKNPQVDAQIAREFGDLVEKALNGALVDRANSPRHCLAEILLLDQFTRNIYRDTPNAFAGDPRARNRARHLLAAGIDSLTAVEKVFVYLPFEHSEDLTDQKRSMALFHQLLESAPGNLRSFFDRFYDYAVRHHVIIDRFGRFPHRNKILGRESTPDEIQFLLQPGSSF